MTEKKVAVTGRLESWKYWPGAHVLTGDVYDDAKKRFLQGEYIHTSHLSISKIDAGNLKEGDVVRTRYSTYLLGKPYIPTPPLTDEQLALLNNTIGNF